MLHKLLRRTKEQLRDEFWYFFEGQDTRVQAPFLLCEINELRTLSFAARTTILRWYAVVRGSNMSGSENHAKL